MTIVRQAQYTAEPRVVTDITSFAGDSQVSTLQANTGLYSYPRYNNIGPIGKGLVTPLSAIRLGFWLYLTSSIFQTTTLLYYAGHGLNLGNSSNAIFIELRSTTGEMIVGRYTVATGAYTILATASLPSQFATTGTWFPIGITHKVDAADGFLSVYIGGTRVLHYTGDTRPSHYNAGTQYQSTVANVLVAGAGGTSGVQGFTGSQPSSAGAFLDDLYIDSYVGEVDGPVPARRFLESLPDGPGVDAAWTPVPVVANYLNVDDNPNNGDTDYNKALAAGLRDTFTYGNIVLPADHRIVAVLPSPFARRLDTEIQHLLSVHAWDGLQYLDSADLDLNMSYDVPVFARFPTQPDGSEWNEADFNSMQFGYASRGVF